MHELWGKQMKPLSEIRDEKAIEFEDVSDVYRFGFDDAVKIVTERKDAEISEYRRVLEFARLNSRECSDHVSGNNIPFCTNECEVKREVSAVLAKYSGENK